MSSASFRLESFRSWNPFQDKAQPLLNSLDICRYPSPVSITTTPPPSNPGGSASDNRKSHPQNPEQHPLPPRPPVEVCLDDLPQSDSQTTRHEPEHLGQITSANTHTDTFDSEDVSSAILPDSSFLETEHQFSGVELDDLEPTVIAGGHSLPVESGYPIQTQSFPNNETIDPAILNDHAFLGPEHIQATENFTGITTCSEDPSFQHGRDNAEGAMTPDSLPSKIQKRSSVRKRHTKSGSGRSNSRPDRHKSVSFAAVRAQFSALPIEDRLQFLSWLFEGALSHCVYTRTNIGATSATRCIPNQNVDTAYDCDYPNVNTELDNAKDTLSSRKRKRWTEEEERLVVKLRGEQNLAWSEVTERFAQQFPRRSQGSMQVYWSTTLKNQWFLLAEGT